MRTSLFSPTTWVLLLGGFVSAAYAAPSDAMGLHLQCGSSADCITLEGQEVTFERAPRLVIDASTVSSIAVSPDDVSVPGAHTLSINLKTQAGQKFFDLTTNNLGKRLAVLVGDHVVNAPEIKTPVEGGEVTLALTPESYEKVRALPWFEAMVRESDKAAYQRKMLFLGLGVLVVVVAGMFFRKRARS